MTYGLRAGERPEYREKAADLGTFYHDALNLFFRRAKEQDLSARMLTAEQQQTLLDEILPELIGQMDYGNPGEIANQLLTYCIKQSKGQIRDDMTVLVMGIWETEQAAG